MILYSTKNYDYLKNNILSKDSSFKAGNLQRKTFPDGERYIRIEDNVKGQDVAVIGGTISDQDTLEIFDLACALVKYGARSLSLVIPYFGYSTMERSTKVGEIVVAKTRARLLSAIPQASYGNKIFLVDLHSEGIPYYFEGDVSVSHLYAKDEVIELVKEITKGDKDIVLGSTDAGRAKWVESLANDIGCEAAFVYKRRLSGAETKLTGINADVKGKHVVIYDDMIRTGGSLIQAGEAYLNAGASKVSAITTHSIFPNIDGKSSMDRLKDSGLFYKIASTNSHPRVLESDFKDVLVKDLSDKLAKALKE